jgi:hypothetical protein
MANNCLTLSSEGSDLEEWKFAAIRLQRPVACRGEGAGPPDLRLTIRPASCAHPNFVFIAQTMIGRTTKTADIFETAIMMIQIMKGGLVACKVTDFDDDPLLY